MKRSPYATIALMMEDISSPTLTGAGMAQDISAVDPNMTSGIHEIETVTTDADTELDPDHFTDKELKLGKRFIELIGGPERARELINKCDEGMEYLGLVDSDAEEAEVDTIRHIAGLMPTNPSYPTGIRQTDLSAMYNPGAIKGGY